MRTSGGGSRIAIAAADSSERTDRSASGAGLLSRSTTSGSVDQDAPTSVVIDQKGILDQGTGDRAAPPWATDRRNAYGHQPGTSLSTKEGDGRLVDDGRTTCHSVSGMSVRFVRQARSHAVRLTAMRKAWKSLGPGCRIDTSAFVVKVSDSRPGWP